MSRIKPFLFAALIVSMSATAQPSANSNVPEGFRAGTLVTAEHTHLQGHIKESIKKNSEVLLITPDGKMKKYKAAQLSEVTIDNTTFIVDGSSFYKIVSEGPKVKLLQKASAGGDRIEYNGAEPIVVSGSVGNYDDYFIQNPGEKQLNIVRRKDIRKLAEKWEKECPEIGIKTKQGGVELSDIVQLVSIYNACDK